MTLHAAALAFGFLLAAVAGGGLISGPTRPSPAATLERIVLATAAGLPLLGAAVFLFSVVGIPVSGVSLAAAAAAWRLAAALLKATLLPPARIPESAARPTRLSSAAFLIAGAVSLAKIARAPLWSWDHFAIWGANARKWQLVPRTLGPIRLFHFHVLFQDYLPGLPLAWRGLCLGARPSPADFKLCHLAFALMLLVAVRRAVSAAGGSETAGNVLAAWLAASPLLWDTEAVGLADLPLALCAAVALVFLPVAGSRTASAAFWISLAALPWIKNEGLWLSAGILSATAFQAPAGSARRRQTVVSTGALVLVVLAAAAGRMFQSGETPTFFQGDWAGRLVSRLPALPHICWRMAVELLRPGWLGIWPAVAVALLAAAFRKEGRPRQLWPMLLIPLGADLGAYLATYLVPEAHIASSFGRVGSALLPAALVAAAAALSGVEAGAERNLPARASS